MNLIDAAKQGNIIAVKEALEQGIDDINLKDTYGFTALEWASRQGQAEVAKLLIDKGADVNAKDYKGNTSLMQVSLNGHMEIVNLLIDKD